MRLAEIRIYPIKSCGGISVASAALEPRGFAGDRRYMLVDERGRFLTQREHPRMATIRVREANGPVGSGGPGGYACFGKPGGCADSGDPDGSGGFGDPGTSGKPGGSARSAQSVCGWVVEAPGQRPLALPASLASGPRRAATVWRDTLKLTEADAAVNQWFSDALRMPCRLVNLSEGHVRPLSPGRGRDGDQVSLADGAPVLLTATASLAQLNARLPRPVGMLNFRPNLVAETDTPFEEDRWGRIRVGQAEFDVAWACTRCVLTTIDPETATKDPDEEPIRTLKTFRWGPRGVMFGQNLIPRRLGPVSVGDPIYADEALDNPGA